MVEAEDEPRHVLDETLIENLNNIPRISEYRSTEEVDKDLKKRQAILVTNVRSLRKNINNLNETLDHLTNINSVKCILTTEVHNADSDEKNNYMKNFEYVSKIRSDKTKRGGVGIFINKNTQYEIILLHINIQNTK